MIGRRLDRLADWLGDKEWLEDDFTAGDLLMVDVLRIVDDTDLLQKRPNLLAYVERGTARPLPAAPTTRSCPTSRRASDRRLTTQSRDVTIRSLEDA
jgi:glutathione S-transferase